MKLDTHDRHLLRRIEIDWPDLAELCAQARAGGSGRRETLRTVAATARRRRRRWQRRDTIRLAKWEAAPERRYRITEHAAGYPRTAVDVTATNAREAVTAAYPDANIHGEAYALTGTWWRIDGPHRYLMVLAEPIDDDDPDQDDTPRYPAPDPKRSTRRRRNRNRPGPETLSAGNTTQPEHRRTR